MFGDALATLLDMREVTTFGKLFFALSMIGFGVQHFVYKGLLAGLELEPEAIPGHTILGLPDRRGPVVCRHLYWPGQEISHCCTYLGDPFLSVPVGSPDPGDRPDSARCEPKNRLLRDACPVWRSAYSGAHSAAGRGRPSGVE